MTIAIRVDGSRAIGTGHVRRTISLAKALRLMGAEVLFVWRDLGLDYAGEFAAAGFRSVRLPRPSGTFSPGPADPAHATWAEVPANIDAGETIAALASERIDRVIVDHYAFDGRWHRAVGDALGAPVAAIDDLADRALDVDLVIDHNLAADHRAKYADRLPPDARVLGGPRYALLDPTYADKPRYSFNNSLKSIGVFMGGADRTNATARVLDAIAATGFGGAVEAVSTSANPHLPELAARAQTDAQLSLAVDLPDLSDFFARHDLQVGAGGGATWERCCIGAPTLGVVVADNQRAALHPLTERGTIAYCAAVDIDLIAASVAALIASPERRAAFAEASRALVDGNGARRIATALLVGQLTVRPAALGDAARMFEWRNDPSVRGMSRNMDAFGWVDHVAWLRKTLASDRRTLLVGEIGLVPVGVIRFDQMADSRREVSLYLDPSYLGLGLGLALLRAGEHAVGPAGGFAATVLSGNPASSKLFAAAGYRKLSAGQWTKDAGDGMKDKP